MSAYPGTVKVFQTRVDNIDTVLAAHVNDLQDEVFALQQILGTNPHGSSTTVASRISTIEDSTTATTIGGNKTYSGAATFSGTIRSTNAAQIAAIGATNQPLQVGPDGGYNLIVDGRRVQGRNAGAAADLLLQPFGGNAYVGAGRVWTSANDGPGSSLDADKLDGHDGAYFAVSNHQHAANFAQVYRTTTQSIPKETWTTVTFDSVSKNVAESGSALFDTSGNTDRFFTPPAIGPALYYIGFRASFASSNSGVTRGVRIIDSDGRVIDQELESADFSKKDFISNGGMYYFPGTSGYYLRLQVFHDAATSLTLAANSTTRPFKATFAAVVRANG